MSLISSDIQFIHIYFLLVFIIYFFREWFIYLLHLDPKKRVLTRFFKLYIQPISYLFSGILVFISYKNSKRKKGKIQTNKNDLQLIYYNNPIKINILLIRTFLVSLFFFLSKYLFFIFYIFIDTEAENLESLLVFYLIFIYHFSKKIHKVQYYRHHTFSFIISIFFMIILGIFDFKTIHDDFWEVNVVFYLLVLIISICFNSFAFVLGKKALISEFLSPQTILLYEGIYQSLLAILSTIPFIFIKIDISGNKENVFNIFSDVLNNIKNVILCFLYMIAECTYELFLWIIIDRFSPNDLAIALIIKGLASEIFSCVKDYYNHRKVEDLTKKIFELIIYIILIIITSIHSEIIIINICELNKYTKKNISKMGNEDYNLTKEPFAVDSLNIDDDEEEEEKEENNIDIEMPKR